MSALRLAAVAVAVAVADAVLLAACVTDVPAKDGLGSFRVEILSVTDEVPDPNPPTCLEDPLGQADCRRKFSPLGSPVRVTLEVTALDRQGLLEPDFAGQALVDVRPGRVLDVGPTGLLATFVAGRATVELGLVQAFGPTRVWVEDCGSSGEPGSFATGVSSPIWFDNPRIAEINATDDNTLSAMMPRATNVCRRRRQRRLRRVLAWRQRQRTAGEDRRLHRDRGLLTLRL
jgi:hypothetical protein